LKFLNKTAMGVLIWLGIAAGVVWAFSRIADRSPQGLRQLYQYATYPRQTVNLRFPGMYPLAVGDFVFSAESESYPPIGYISRVGDRSPQIGIPVYSDSAVVTFYGNAPPFGAEDFLEYHCPADDLAWVLRTMLPDTKRAEITRLVVDTYLREQEPIVAAIRPIVSQSLRDAAEIIREDLAAAFAKRSNEFQEIGQRYQQQLIEDRIVPLIRQEIWPIIREEGEPLANQMAMEVWREISLFRFAWRYVYDRSGIPDESLTRLEFERFLTQKVGPIFESHLADILETQNRIIARISRNEPTRAVIGQGLEEIAADQQIREVVNEVFREVMIENQPLRDSLTTNWNSPPAQAALREINQRIDPAISELGIILFGSADGEITPEFARVLRHRILQKDTRWLILHSAGPVSKKDQPAAAGTPALTDSSVRSVRIAHPAGEIPYAPARKR